MEKKKASVISFIYSFISVSCHISALMNVIMSEKLITPSWTYGFELSDGPGQCRYILSADRDVLSLRCVSQSRDELQLLTASFPLLRMPLLNERHTAQQRVCWYHTHFLASRRLFLELRVALGKKTYLCFYHDGFGDGTWKEGEIKTCKFFWDCSPKIDDCVRREKAHI